MRMRMYMHPAFDNAHLMCTRMHMHLGVDKSHLRVDWALPIFSRGWVELGGVEGAILVPFVSDPHVSGPLHPIEGEK